MDQDKSYYHNLLRYYETVQLESVGELLKIELAIYEIRKILQEIDELGEYENPALDRSKQTLSSLRIKHDILADEIADLELDISHAKFMIDISGRDKTDER